MKTSEKLNKLLLALMLTPEKPGSPIYNEFVGLKDGFRRWF
jgi:hypothetical protein